MNDKVIAARQKVLNWVAQNPGYTTKIEDDFMDVYEEGNRDPFDVTGSNIAPDSLIPLLYEVFEAEVEAVLTP